MAETSTLRKASNAIGSIVGLPIAILQYSASEPLITGPLLYILTRGPQHIRERLLALLRSNLLAKNAANRLATAINVLKALFALGVLQRINKALNYLAMNYWYLPGTKPMAKWNWDGKTEVVVITGGCSGFGYEMVKGFAGKAKIVVLDVLDLPKELEHLPEVYYYHCDLTDFGAITSTAESIRNRLGNPTVLINNAGIGAESTLLGLSNKGIDAISKVNFASHLVTIKEFVPGMLEARKGHVVAISSMAAFVSAAGLVPYCMTKVGVLALHEGLRNELLTRYKNGHTVATTCVHPSWHRTGLTSKHEEKINKIGITLDPASNVSDAVIEQVMSHRSGQIFMPRSQERAAGTRRLPIWLQDVLFFAVGNKVRLDKE